MDSKACIFGMMANPIPANSGMIGQELNDTDAQFLSVLEISGQDPLQNRTVLLNSGTEQFAGAC